MTKDKYQGLIELFKANDYTLDWIGFPDKYFDELLQLIENGYVVSVVDTESYYMHNPPKGD
jgi:hypothetical protein